MKSQRDEPVVLLSWDPVEVAVSQMWCCLVFLTVLSLQAGVVSKQKGYWTVDAGGDLEPPATQ